MVNTWDWGRYHAQQLDRQELKKDSNFVGIGLILLFVAMQFVATLVLVLLMFAGVVDPVRANSRFWGMDNTSFLLVYMLIYASAMGLPMVIAALVARRQARPFAVRRPLPAADWVPALLAGMGVSVVANLVAGVIASFFSSFGITVPDVEMMVDTPLSLGLNILILAVLPALLEEMVFRGYVMGTLRRYGDGLAVVVSALLFGLMHGNVVQIPFAFLLGLVLGVLALQGGSIWPAVALHFLNNLMAVLLEYAAFHISEEQLQTVSLLLFLALALVGAVAVIILFARRSPLVRPTSSGQSLLTAKERASGIFLAPAMLISIILFLLETLLVSLSSLIPGLA